MGENHRQCFLLNKGTIKGKASKADQNMSMEMRQIARYNIPILKHVRQIKIFQC